MGKWKEYRLSDVAEIIGGGTPKTTVSEYWDGNIPWLSVVDFNNGRKIVIDTEKKITEKGLQESSTKLLTKGQLIISARGTVGALAMLGRDMAFNQSCYGLNAIPDITFNDYLYYLLKVNIATLTGQAHGAVFDTITRETFDHITVSLPPLPEQKSIASILGSLDDKINLLHRQNKTLEASAETLFRQWFVEEADEEWEKITLSDIADHVKLSINPIIQPTTLFEHYSIPAFDEGQEPKRELGSEIRSNKYRVLPNTILVSKLNPKTPRVWSVYGEVDEDSSICSTEFQVVKPKRSDYFGFVYCYLKSWYVMQELANAVGGTSGSHQRVNPEDIFNLTLRRPPLDKFKKFDRITNDYWEKISRNRKQIRTLTPLRDTLLPKLMSGEVRVKES